MLDNFDLNFDIDDDGIASVGPEGIDLDGAGIADAFPADTDGDGQFDTVAGLDIGEFDFGGADDNLYGMVSDLFALDGAEDPSHFADGFADAFDMDFDDDSSADGNSYDLNGDGIADGTGYEVDIDGDGIADEIHLDTDGDGIIDTIAASYQDGDISYTEVAYDKDHDGIVENNTVYIDTNNDGVFDRVTELIDTDGDGEADTIITSEDYNQDGIFDSVRTEVDTDGDGVIDNITIEYDTDGNGMMDSFEQFIDKNGDGITDEMFSGQLVDTDGDGVYDTYVKSIDADGDGSFETVEIYDYNPMADELHLSTVDEVDVSYNAEGVTNNEYGNFDPDSCSPEDIVGNPTADMSHWEYQGDTNRCALYSQLFVIEEITGEELNINDLVQLCEKNGWTYENGSTPILNMGNVLGHYGIEHKMSFRNDMDDLTRALENGEKVIVSIDADEIWFGESDDVFTPNDGVNHAVEVIGIDNSDPEHPMVILNDSGTPNGQGELVPADTFMDAWDDGGNQMIEIF